MQSTLAVINLSTIARNALLMKQRAGVPLIAVLKDDAYGHGAERVALALKGIASSFAVSAVREGICLRTAGIGEEILLFTPCLSEEEAVLCSFHDLTPTISSSAAMNVLIAAAEKYRLSWRAQLAVNTGMNRYGIRPERACSAAKRAKEAGIAITGVFSHLYAPEDPSARADQAKRFFCAAEKVREVFPNAVRHLSATGGILAGREFAFDAVRCGIALYGYLPEGFRGAIAVKPAAKLYATVSHRGKFTGGGAGYGRAEREYSFLHTLRLGYGDGAFRASGLGVGKLCMDAFLAEGDLPFGTRKLILSEVESYAKRAGTTAYEALVNLLSKAEKRYIG